MAGAGAGAGGRSAASRFFAYSASPISVAPGAFVSTAVVVGPGPITVMPALLVVIAASAAGFSLIASGLVFLVQRLSRHTCGNFLEWGGQRWDFVGLC
jgi:hypothetical protein